MKLPHVLDTSLLGRVIHNARVLRTEVKCGNVKPQMIEKAWHMIEMGLLASRYIVHFAESISTAALYNEHVSVDGHDPTKVVQLEIRETSARVR